MQSNRTRRASGVAPRIRSAKNRCRRAISLMPNTGVTEDAATRAAAELEKAADELRTASPPTVSEILRMPGKKLRGGQRELAR
jgi:hypothetical protein